MTPSRNALRQFKAANGLPSDDIWDVAGADCRAAIHHSSKASRQWTQWPALAPPRLLLRLLNQPIERVPQFEG
jgi:hypothetical protein